MNAVPNFCYHSNTVNRSPQSMKIVPTREACRTLGLIGCVLGTVGIGFALGMPSILRFRATAKFREFLSEAQVQEMSDAMVEHAVPGLVLSLTLSVATLVLGVGLIRDWRWAPHGWLVASFLWVLFYVLGLTSGTVEIAACAGLAIRMVVLGYSVRLLVHRQSGTPFALNARQPDRMPISKTRP